MPAALTFTSLQVRMRAYLERGSVTDPTVYEQLPWLINMAERQIATELKVQGFIQVVTASFQVGVAVYAKPDRWKETVSINYGTGDQQVASIAVTDGGAEYLAPPIVSLVGGGGSGAAATAITTNGIVTAIQVTNGGSGYTSPPTIVMTGGDGFGAAGTVTLGTQNNTREQLYPRSYEVLRARWPDDDQVAPPEIYADYDFNNMIVAPTPGIAYPYEWVYWEQPALLDDSTQTNWLTEYAPNLLLYGSLLASAPFLKDDSRIAVWQQFYDRIASGLSGEDLRKILDRAQRRKDA